MAKFPKLGALATFVRRAPHFPRLEAATDTGPCGNPSLRRGVGTPCSSVMLGRGDPGVLWLQ